MTETSDINLEQKIVQTDNNKANGQDKCPKCGATDISNNAKTGKLRCNFCRHEFEPEKVEGLVTDITKLEGEVIGSGTQDIDENAENILTLKCSSCGAEVVIDTTESTNARCHWCRNFLSINEQIPNGSVPDMVLPFNLTRNEAKDLINEFVKSRKFFAHPKFKKEFTTDNIMGAYFPYMIVDVNSHGLFVGKGEHEARRYTRGQSDNKKTYYDADVYSVEREFDFTVEGLTIESSSDKLDKKASDKTNNIINSIMPFDIENCIKWNSNYLKGYSSEKRDINIDELRPIVEEQVKDIARHKTNDTLKHYDRGVCWASEQLNTKGRQWKSAYLPVWLYSYKQDKGNNKNLLHYVAVNARTKETMGSIPVHIPKLLGFSVLVELFSSLITFFLDWEYDWVFLLSAPIFFAVMYMRYRNTGARHHHESETKFQRFNLRQKDDFIEQKKGLSNSTMHGANNKKVNG